MDLVDERLEKARSVGIEYTVNSLIENLIPKLKEITSGRMAECVIEATGSLPAIRSALDIASYRGRIALVGWPNQEAILPTGLITKKGLCVIGSRTSTGEIPLAIDLITWGKVKVGQQIRRPAASLQALTYGGKSVS